MARTNLQTAGRLITPLDPSISAGRRAAPPASPAARHAQQRRWFGGLSCATASSCGSVHGVNEDACSRPGDSWRVFIVADGVGGGAMASLASRELVLLLHAALDTRRVDADSVRHAMLAADRAIASRIAEVTQAPGAATVALCAPVNATASKWLLAWVGDCRVYRAGADGAVALLTRDDTFGHLNETPAPGGSPDDPARMVGNGAVSQTNVVLTRLAVGESLLACTDGVHKHVAPADFASAPGRRRTAAERCCELVALARANGSTDDATVLIVQRSGLRWWGSAR